MSGIAYPPPTENLPIFDSTVFSSTSNVPLTVADGLKYFLSFPNAQGTENLSVTNVFGTLTCDDNIVMSGTYLTNYIEFPDGSQQFSASSGGGSGDALLAGGTSTTPQVFTGYNEFSNADGQITLTNTTNSNSVNIASDDTNYPQLDIQGALSIGNSTNLNVVLVACDDTIGEQLNIAGKLSVGNISNSNTVVIESGANNPNQLNIDGSLTIAGAGTTVLLKGYTVSSPTFLKALQISGGGLLLGSNSGTQSTSTYVFLACDDSNNNILNVSGDIFLDSSYKLTTSEIYFPPYPLSTSANNATLTQDDNGLSINNEFTLYSYSTPANHISMYADAVNNHQLDVIGTLNASTLTSGTINIPNVDTNMVLTSSGTTTPQLTVGGNLLATGNIILGSGSTTSAFLKFGNGSVQTVAYTGGAPILATYTSSALDTLLTPFVWSFTGISNSLGNQVGWILYSNSAITTNSSSTVFSNTNATITPSDLNNYIYGSGTAIQIPYKFNDGTTTTNQTTYYPSTVVALGGFTLDAIGNTSGTTTFTVTLNSSSNTNFTNASTLKLVFYAG
jgi:hypothetical protein